MKGVNFLEKKSQKCLVVMFYSSTFAPAIERDSGDEMLRNIKKLFEKNFEKYLELNNKSYYLCIRVCLTIAKKEFFERDYISTSSTRA